MNETYFVLGLILVAIGGVMVAPVLWVVTHSIDCANTPNPAYCRSHQWLPNITFGLFVSVATIFVGIFLILFGALQRPTLRNN